MNMDIWKERSLQEMVQALRHLPSGNWLTQSHYKLEHDLIHDLLSLEEGVDPIMWLEDHYADRAACVLLWQGIAYLRANLQSAKKVLQAHQATTDYAWLGDLLFLPESGIERLFHEINNVHFTEVSADMLRTVFRNIHIFYRHTDFSNVTKSGHEFFILMNNLLMLPANTDPISHIKTQFSHIAAAEMLYSILNELRLPPTLWDEKPLRIYKPSLRSSINNVSLRISKIAFLRIGFTLTLSSRIPRTLITPIRGFLYVSWQGVERVSDNLDHQYIIEYRLPKGKGLSWWFNQTIQLLCYPSLAPKATEIIMYSKETTMLIMGIKKGAEQKIEKLNEIYLGDFKLQVSINNHPGQTQQNSTGLS